MARIRTIKPEFPQSESMGSVSRDSRLLFIMLFTLADDEGRLRGNSRMLASLLFPYDVDAPKLINKWIDELIKQSCIIRYQIADATYIQICKWLNHQKIDKPSKSKIPAPDGHSIEVASIREDSLLDQGKDQGKDQDQGSGIEGNVSAFEFEKFWNVYDKKIEIAAAEKAWKKLSIDENLFSLIINSAKKYVLATPDKTFRKNPATWLNSKCWNDEIIVRANQNYESAKDKSRREFAQAIMGKVQNEQSIIDIN
jgi:hypothetical protein